MTKKRFFLVISLAAFLLQPGADARNGMVWSNMTQQMTRSGYTANLAFRSPCFPHTCASQGKNCGSISDGCGHMIDCGSCSGNDICGEGGTPNVCGQTCYQFGYLSTEGGVSNLFASDTCANSPKNLTHATTGHDFSNLSISHTLDTMGFLETDTTADGHTSEYMNMISGSGYGWTLLDDHPAQPQMIAWGPGETIAFVDKEPDGHDVLRLNANAAAGYPQSGSVDILDMTSWPVKSLAWIPTSDGSASHRLIVSADWSRPTPTERPYRVSSLYVVQLSNDYRSGRLIPLEAALDAEPASLPMEGLQPSPSRRGQRLLFVRQNESGRQKIYQCDFDFHDLDLHPDSGRAYCPSPIELNSTAASMGDLASPCWSYDDQWIFYTWRVGAAPWNLYRDRYIGSFERQGLSTDAGADQPEVVCFPRLYQAVTTSSATVAPLRPSEQAVPATRPVQVLTYCTSDSVCPSGQVCREHTCVHP